MRPPQHPRLADVEILTQILAIEAGPRIRSLLGEMFDDPDEDVHILADFALALQLDERWTPERMWAWYPFTRPPHES